ncbi:MAG: isoprenylcysteine carboxylmethyltransferase family protein, partial [Firmicutes bacterium]|nr:isoprenylcysteine carboxylmethyltransferase family protein [Bacillota bacterium]
MKGGLLKEALIKIIAGIVLMGVLLFLPAGTIRWQEGWLLMIILFVPMFMAGLLMYFKAPDLLRSRLKAKETQS